MKKKLRYGLTEIVIENDILTIVHSGNMGNSIEHSVNPNLSQLGVESIEQLKQKYQLISEFGSPDYYYEIKFNFNSIWI